MLNWNRTVVDSLVVTFVPTCSSVVDPLQLSDPLPTSAGDSPVRTWYVREKHGDPNTYWAYSVALPDLTKLKPGPLPNGTPGGEPPALSIYKVRRTTEGLVRTGDPVQFGNIEWSGYMSPDIDAQSQAVISTSLHVELRGAVSAPLGDSSGNVGTITLTEALERNPENGHWIVRKPLSGYVTTGLYQALSEDQRTIDYWQSIPSCDLITSTQKQDLTNHATQLNDLFKLTNAQRLRIQQ